MGRSIRSSPGKAGPTIYPLALRIPRYSTFAAATVEQLFSSAQLQRALHYRADTFASLYLQNNGNGTFTRCSCRISRRSRRSAASWRAMWMATGIWI